MDTELARTFLAVVAGGSFIDAARKLHVTQSTVSSRMQRLEETLGAALFARSKSGVVLTPAGRQFQPHAALLTRTVEQAREEIGVVSGFRATLTVGGRLGLWEDLLTRWMAEFRALAPDVAVRAVVGFDADLMQDLVDGKISMCVVFTPQAHPGLVIEPLPEARLVLASTHADASAQPTADYVYVDWGPDFFAQHSLAFPDYAGASLSSNIGWLALQYVLAHGGTAYFPERMLHAYESTGRLFRIAAAPSFRLPAYLCFPANHESQPLAVALETIRRVASHQTCCPAP